MKIAIIGAGNVGGTLGRRFAALGHEISFGVRDPENPKVQEILSEIPGAVAAGNESVAEGADIIILTTPWNATEEAVHQCGDLTGKIVIDATNPIKLGATDEMLELGFNTSAGEHVAAWANGARVFKTLNQVGREIMAVPIIDGRSAVMFVAGPKGDAQSVVMTLIGSLGFEALYIGDITLSRILEPMAMVWIHSAIAMGMGRDWALSVVRRG